MARKKTKLQMANEFSEAMVLIHEDYTKGQDPTVPVGLTMRQSYERVMETLTVTGTSDELARAVHTVVNTSQKDRYDFAIALIRRLGVKARTNVMSCCRGCILPEDLGIDSDSTVAPYMYTFGGQGDKIKWIAGNPYRNQSNRRAPKPASSVYVYHGVVDGQNVPTRADRLKAGMTVATAFSAMYFEVDWSGDIFSSIEVKFS